MVNKRNRILVIDDDPMFRSLIASLLRKRFMISVASEGSEGFYKALEHPPDIAIIDIQMPGWDGLKTLKAFRGHPSLSHVKIVILTSDASRQTVLAAIHGGANDYVIKTSFCKKEFCRKLDRLLAMLPGSQGAISELDRDIKPAAVGVSPPEPSVTNATVTVTPTTIADADTTNVLDEDADSQLQEMIDGWE